MKTNLLQLTKRSVFVLAFAGLVLNACKKEDDKPAPDLPTVDTMVMPTGDFDENNKPGKTLGDYENWTYSAVNVGIWNLILTVNLAVPVASFKEAFNHKGVYQAATNEWVWDYNVKVAGKVYTCALHASESGSNIAWKMLVSQQGGFSNFTWYTGLSAKDGLSGSWTLNQDANNATPYLGIEWKKSSSSAEADIKYSNIIPSHAGNGGYIHYGIASGDLDRFYTVFLKEEDKLTEIEWSKTNKNGRVKDEKHFGDTLHHCWTTALKDTVCN